MKDSTTTTTTTSSSYHPVSVLTDSETAFLVEDGSRLLGDDDDDDDSPQIKKLGNASVTTMYFGCTLMMVVALIHLGVSVIMRAQDTRLEALPRPDIFAGLSL